MSHFNRIVLAVGLIVTMAAFQNCSKPQSSNSKTSASNSPAPSPSPASASNRCYGAFCASYYDDLDQLVLAVERTESVPVNYDWGGDAPDPSMEADSFSAYYVGTFDFNAGDVEFKVTADDGVRVAVDGNIVIDAYIDQGPTDYSAIVSLTGGIHQVEIFYYENGGGAVLRASWDQL